MPKIIRRHQDDNIHLSRLRDALEDITSAHRTALHEAFMLSSSGDGDESARPTLDGLQGALLAYRDHAQVTMATDAIPDDNMNLVWRASEVALALLNPEYTPDPSIRSDVLDVASRF
jgi:hypothetical protein